MVSGPEICRLLDEFGNASSVSKVDARKGHHEETPGFQKMFLGDVQKLLNEFDGTISPFEEEDLINIETRDLAEKCVVDTVNTIELIGQEQCNTFMKGRLIDCQQSLGEPIKKNKMALFSNQNKKRSRTASNITSLKSNVALFSKLIIATQNKKGNLAEFFKHSNQMVPPSLSKDVVTRSGDKPILMDCFENTVSPVSECPNANGVIIDGPMLVNSTKPSKKDQTFSSYAEEAIKPKIYKLSKEACRVDIIWDVYNEKSLKGTTRSNRGGRVQEGGLRQIHMFLANGIHS